MENVFSQEKTSKGKAGLGVIIALTLVVSVIFWVVIQSFQVQGLPLYFMQLGLYLAFFLLAWWGIRQEQISLPFSKRMMVEGLAWSLAGWLVFVLLIQLLGLVQLPDAFLALQKTPAWKIGAQILSTWIFVGMGEEVLFRGYFIKAFWRHFTLPTDPRRMLKAALLSSAFFSLWHLPARIAGILSGEFDWVTLLISLLVLFLMGLGFTYLFVRSENIFLTGLVHGLMDYPLVGKNTQLSFLILLVAIACVEIARRAAGKKAEAQS